MNILFPSLVFIVEIVGIYMLSRIALQKSYIVLKRLVKKDRWVITIVSLVYFPGTAVHEFSHYIVALLLNMHPSEIRLFPTIEGNKVKLGHVLYEKNPHEFFRPILVGIAPLFGGLLSLWLIVQTKVFPGNTLWQTVFFGYLILSLSANMFSSQQDLIGISYLIPIFLLIGFLFYLFPIQLSPEVIKSISSPLLYFFHIVQGPLVLSLIVNGLLIVLFSVNIVK